MVEKKEQPSNEKSPMEKLDDFRTEAQSISYKMAAILDLCSSSSYFQGISSFDYSSILSLLESEVEELQGFLDGIEDIGYKIEKELSAKQAAVKYTLTARSHVEANIPVDKIRQDALAGINEILLGARFAELQMIGGEQVDWGTLISNIIAGAKKAQLLLMEMKDKAV